MNDLADASEIYRPTSIPKNINGELCNIPELSSVPGSNLCLSLYIVIQMTSDLSILCGCGFTTFQLYNFMLDLSIFVNMIFCRIFTNRSL